MSPITVQDDLAFLRALTDGDVARGHQALFGRIYFGAGLIYGAQVALSLADHLGLIGVPGGEGTLSLAANGLFLPWMCWELWRNRGAGAGSLTNKAINAAFAAVGAANGAMAAILILAAWRLQEPRVAALISCVIFALQGTAWFVAYILRRRTWLAAVAAGWTACGVAMAFFLNDIVAFLSVVAIGVAFCMALPGFVMMRLAARARA
jgi:hypothetical protein